MASRSGEPSAKEKDRRELRFASDVCSCLTQFAKQIVDNLGQTLLPCK